MGLFMHHRFWLMMAGTSLGMGCGHSLSDSAEVRDQLTPTDWAVDGCRTVASAFGNVTAWRTEIPTVIQVEWATVTPSASAVIFEFDGELHQTPLEAGVRTGHEAWLLGIPAHTPVRFVMVKEEDDERVCSSAWIIETGGIPAALPELNVESTVELATLDGFLVAPAITTGQSFLSLIDGHGRYVWAYRHEELVWRMRMGLDGRSVLFNHNAAGEDEPGPIHRIAMDGTPLETVEIDGAHRDFVELPDGGIATFVWQLQEMEDPATGQMRTIVGDGLVEVDATGHTRQVWSIWDAHTPSLETSMSQGLYPADPEAEEWTHANALTYIAEDDSFLISLDAWNSIVKIDRSTGRELWFLSGGTGGSFDASEPDLISNAHSVRPTEDGRLLVFNRNDFANGECAEAVELEIDETEGTVSKRWSYGSEDCQIVTYLGNAIPVLDGQRLIVFSTSGRIDWVDAEGNGIWQLRSDLGFGFALSDFTESLYPTP